MAREVSRKEGGKEGLQGKNKEQRKEEAEERYKGGNAGGREGDGRKEQRKERRKEGPYGNARTPAPMAMLVRLTTLVHFPARCLAGNEQRGQHEEGNNTITAVTITTIIILLSLSLSLFLCSSTELLPNAFETQHSSIPP
jgi:hypothetical protein